jgi:hypothetical protein
MTDFLLLKHDVPLRFGTYSEAPQSPQNGMIYYDTTLNLFRVYENGQWQALSSRDYAKNSIASFDVKESCEAATTTNLSATYANGTSGVGATLTGAGALPSLDGVNLSVGKRVLLLGQTAAKENGVYTVTALNPFVLTRAVDFDESEEVNGGEFVFVKNGTNYGNCAFVCTNSGPATIGTTAIVFTQISGNARTLQQYYATGNQIDTASGRNVIIAGTEKLEVTSSGGVEITGALSAGATILSTASVPEVMSVASGKLAVNLNGDITKLNNVAITFPSSASMANYALTNNGSGSLRFSNLSVQNMNDVTLTSLSNGDYLQYTTNGNWLNKFALETGNRNVVVATSSSIPIGVNSAWAGDNAILDNINNANFVQCQSISNASWLS